MNIFLNFLGGVKRNYKTLILAFIIACVLWTAISVLTFNTISSSIKGIDIEALPTEYMQRNNLRITNEILDKVNITIEGKRYDISDLNSSDFSAEVDLSAVRSAGTYNLPLKVTSKSGRDLVISNTEPEQVLVTLDEVISKDFPIEATAPDVSLSEGYYIESVTPAAATVTLTGSANILNKVAKVEARSTFHGAMTQSTQTASEFYLFNSGGTMIVDESIELSADNVPINITIFKQKELPLNLSIIGFPNNFNTESLKYEIYPEKIIVAAPDELIDNISELELDPINLSDISPAAVSYIPINLPEGYKNLTGTPSARITWKTENYETLGFDISDESIIITNPPDMYDVSLITQALTVKVTGPASRLMSITASDISVTVNLLGTQIREGTQDVSATVQIKGNNQVCWVTGDYKVTVNAQIPSESEPEENEEEA